MLRCCLLDGKVCSLPHHRKWRACAATQWQARTGICVQAVQDLMNPNLASGGLVDGACGYGLLTTDQWPRWAVAGINAQNPVLVNSANQASVDGYSCDSSENVGRAQLRNTSTDSYLKDLICRDLQQYVLDRLAFMHWSEMCAQTTVLLPELQGNLPEGGCGICLQVTCTDLVHIRRFELAPRDLHFALLWLGMHLGFSASASLSCGLCLLNRCTPVSNASPAKYFPVTYMP